METINGLLKALDNKVPASIAKRLDGLQKLNEKLVGARAEYQANPTQESKEQLDEIEDFLGDTQDDLIEDLSSLVEQKRSDDLKAREQEQRNQNKLREEKQAREAEAREAQAKQRQAREKEARELKEKEDLEKKELEEKALGLDGKTETETKKESKIGWGSLLLGGALLVATGGAIKYFGNRK